jgi:transposase
VTELYRLLAATAAERLGLTPRFVPLDTTSFHVDGRDNSDEEPAEQVVPITRGYSRDHRPDFKQVMLELMVEHQAGIPLLMKPLSGNSRDTQGFGEAVRLHVKQWQTTDGLTSLVADSALYREANLEKLAQTQMQWITRVPATLRDAQTALAQADPPAMVSLQEG